MNNTLIERIKMRLDAMGKTERAASLEATGNPDIIRKIRTGITRTPRADTLAALARALGTTGDWLLHGEGNAEQPTKAIAPTETDNTKTHTLPVYGLAAGSTLGHLTMSGEPFEFVDCPPGLLRVKEAYALFVTGSSMEPAYRPGDLVFIHPHRPVRQNDHVVVQEARDGGTITSIKRFERYTDKHIILTQYNPLAEIEISRQAITSVHRVMTTNELFGL